MKELTVGSLFAGVGGICLGLSKARYGDYRFRLVFANEVDPYACETYRANFSHAVVEGDINLILHPENSDDVERYTDLRERMFSRPIDVLDAGFPCQAFSIAGTQRGFDDARGNLFFSIVEVIRKLDETFGKKPRILFLENVKNLKSHDGGRTYRVIKEKLEECGYIIKDAVLNTMHYSDIPQNRERIYIIGFLNREDADGFDMFGRLDDFMVDLSAAERTDIVKSIIDMSVRDGRYFYTKEKNPAYFEELGQPTKKRVRVNIAEDIKEKYEFYQLRRGLYVRKNKSHVCPTLTANMGTGGHNVPFILTDYGIRKLTPTEVFRLQGFPIGDGYVLPTEYNGKPYGIAHLYKQAGNSVSVPVITLIANEILKACAKGDLQMADSKTDAGLFDGEKDAKLLAKEEKKRKDRINRTKQRQGKSSLYAEMDTEIMTKLREFLAERKMTISSWAKEMIARTLSGDIKLSVDMEAVDEVAVMESERLSDMVENSSAVGEIAPVEEFADTEDSVEEDEDDIDDGIDSLDGDDAFGESRKDTPYDDEVRKLNELYSSMYSRIPDCTLSDAIAFYGIIYKDDKENG